MSVVVDLMPPSTLGRYFQIAALSLGGLRAAESTLVFDSPRDYEDLVVRAGEKTLLTKIRLDGGVSLSKQSICKLIEKAAEAPSPRLNYIRQVDAEAVGSAGLNTVCGQEAGLRAMLNMLSYIEKVIDRGGPLMVRDVKIPMLFRATLFGKTRGPRRAEIERCSGDSLGLALVGAVASFMGRLRVRDTTYEYFLLPDGSASSMENYWPALEVLGGVLKIEHAPPSIPEVARTLIEVSGASVDLATYMAALIRVLWADEFLERVSSLAEARAFESMILVRIDSSGNRPQMVWAGPLAISHTVRELAGDPGFRRALRELYVSSSIALRMQGRDGEHARKAVADCVNSLSLLVVSGHSESVKNQLLLSCSRSLAALADHLSESGAGQQLRERALRILRALG
ncbi:MAG: hypothetical protein QXS85_00030 [Acidilobaceae archaeon]